MYKKVAEKVSKKLIVNFDGLCEPTNPAGIACYGFLVKHCDTDNNVLHRGYGLVGGIEHFSSAINNNIAEYAAAIMAMKWLSDNGYADVDNEVILRGDSQLIIRKLKSVNYSRRAAKVTSFYDKAIAERSKFTNIKFEWIKRDYNKEADELAKRAYNEALRDHPVLRRKVREHWVTMLWLEQRMYRNNYDNA